MRICALSEHPTNAISYRFCEKPLNLGTYLLYRNHRLLGDVAPNPAAPTTPTPIPVTSSPALTAKPSTGVVQSELISSTPGTSKDCNSKSIEELIGPYPYNAPPGFHWVPNEWKLEPITERVKGTSFEELFLKKIKSTSKRNAQRCKIDFRGKVRI